MAEAVKRSTLGTAKLTLAVSAAILLAGCGAETGFAVATGAAATVMSTKKLPTDLVADAVTGLDCNSIRQMEDNGTYCRSPDQRVIEKPKYCYRTLGVVSCYATEDPYGDGTQPIH